MKTIRILTLFAVPIMTLWVFINGAFIGDVRICPFWKAFSLGSQPFLAEVWRTDTLRRGDMLYDLASSTGFIGQTPKQIAGLLGEGSDCYVIQDGDPCYAVDLNSSTNYLAFFIDGDGDDRGTISGVTLAKGATPLLGCVL